MKGNAIRTFFQIVALLCCALPLYAMPVSPTIVDTQEQDVLAVCPYPIYDELGNKPLFPDDEWIESSWTITDLTACTGAPFDDPQIPNVLVTMTNMTNRVWGNYYNGQKTHVYYVADPETSLSNYDGLINGELAFIIDAIGINKPLVSESINADGIFEIDETWQFIIQDYVNTSSLAPSAFASIGIGNGSANDTISSGSIVANPEPTTFILLSAGLLCIRRKKII
jgi:hypothetical protein